MGAQTDHFHSLHRPGFFIYICDYEFISYRDVHGSHAIPYGKLGDANGFRYWIMKEMNSGFSNELSKLLFFLFHGKETSKYIARCLAFSKL
jgi:hypothetical protein